MAMKTAGQAVFKLFADDSRLQRSLKRAQDRLKKFGESARNIGLGMSAASASIVAPLTAMASKLGSAGDNLDKMSKRTGIAVESLSMLSFAAEQSGASIDNVQVGIKTMQKGLIDAAERGAGPMAYALERMGMSVDDLQGKKPEEQFEMIADGIASIEDPTTKAATAMEVFGVRSGQVLLPMLNDFRSLKNEAVDLGIVMSTDMANDAAAYTDSMNRLSKVFDMIMYQLGGAVIEDISNLATLIAKNARVVIDWAKENKGLVQTIFTIAAAVGAAGTGLFALGVAATGAAAGLGVVGTILGLLFSPIGLMVAAVAGLAYAFIDFEKVGIAAMEAVDQAVNWLEKNFGETYRTIVDLVKSGNITQAFKLAGAQLKLEAVKIFEALKFGAYSMWIDIKETAAGLWSALKLGFSNFGASTEVLFWSVAGVIKDAFNWAVNAAIKPINWLIEKLKSIPGVVDAAAGLGVDLDDLAIGDFKMAGSDYIENKKTEAIGKIKTTDDAHEKRMKELEKERQDALDFAVGNISQAEARLKAVLAESKAAISESGESVEESSERAQEGIVRAMEAQQKNMEARVQFGSGGASGMIGFGSQVRTMDRLLDETQKQTELQERTANGIENMSDQGAVYAP